MKKISVVIILGLIAVCRPGFSPAALASEAALAEPVDLVSLKESGLSSETIGRYLAQNLERNRLAPAIDAKLLTHLGQYGGDELAAAYLEFDRQTMHESRRDFSTEVIEQLMLSGLEASRLRGIFTREGAAISARQMQTPAPAFNLPVKSFGIVDMTTPASPAAVSPVMVEPAVQTPSRPQAGYQDLRPGQAADPALRLPPPPLPYDIRRQRTNGPWLGVTERELADGHLVEVNALGNSEVAGQEVISRPTGHKVYRYFSGRPDDPRSGADPLQEQRNREDLMIVSAGGRN
jgi:hypothetical protein